MGAVLITATLLNMTISAPTAAADDPDLSGAACVMGSTYLADLVKKASKSRGIGAIAAGLGFLANGECKKALNSWQNGEAATIVVQAPKQTIPPQKIYFQDLVATDLPDPVSPPNISGGLGQIINQAADDYNQRLTACSGYRYQVFFDKCMDGVLDPVYR
jgi:hypothetical protein